MAGCYVAGLTAIDQPDHADCNGNPCGHGCWGTCYSPGRRAAPMKSIRVLALTFLTCVGISALAPRVGTSNSYDTQLREKPDAPPSARFPLGTDALGRDRLARLLYG